MGRDSAVETLDFDHGVKAHIFTDGDSLHPREDYDNFGRTACFHRRYNLGDKPYRRRGTVEDLWKELLGGEWDQLETANDEVYEKWTAVHPNDRYDSPLYQQFLKDSAAAFNKAVQGKLAQRHLILPLYLMDHSGLSIRTSSELFRMCDSAGWDWGCVGFI